MFNCNEMRKNIQEIALKSYTEGLVAGTSGNVSKFDHGTGVMAITPSNIDYKVMKPEDVVLMKLNGEIVEGELKPSSEWRMHAKVYEQLDYVNAIMHTHSPFATSFAVIHETIPLILVEMLPFLGGDIPLAEFALPGSFELGFAAVKVLKNRNACLMSNHGVLAIGKNLDQAYIRAVYVEDAATIYHHARQLATPHLVPEDAVEVLKEKYNLK
jgi:L-ribulose-5-phosphate 4-epimerase